MTSNTRVVVAIPNYNMGRQVHDLTRQLYSQGFKDIFILDDNSSKDITSFISSDNHVLIKGDQNLGAGGNRNRIIDVLHSKGYPDDTIITFIDADTKLIDDSINPSAIIDLFDKHKEAGAIGGKILNPDDSWGAFNYGPTSIREWLSTALTQVRLENISKSNKQKARIKWVEKASKLKSWPPFLEGAEATEVGWLAEALLCIPLDVFEGVGGYDQSLHYCEALQLGYRLEQIGLKRVFDPSITVKHLRVDVRGLRRNVEFVSAICKISYMRLRNS